MSVYTNLTTRFTYKLLNTWGDHDSLAENDKFLKDNGWQDSVVVPFFQAAAPTGWVKSASNNDKMLRVVSGAGGGSGGTTALSATVTRAHTHTINIQSDHTHLLTAHSHSMDSTVDQAGGTTAETLVGAGAQQGRYFNTAGSNDNGWAPSWQASSGAEVSTAAGSHDHGGATDSQLANLSLAYVDIIFCTKSTSSGYTDLTTTFVHNLREVFDYLSQLAANDVFNNARITPTSSVSVFYQAAAPTGWTKLATQNDKALRIVSGSGGGSGGSDSLSSNVVTAHVHGDLTAGGTHTHTSPVHIHSISNFTTAETGGLTGYFADDGSGFIRKTDGTAVSRTVLESRTANDGSVTAVSDADHTHQIQTALTTAAFAYVDVIQCSKNSTGAPQAYSDYSAFFVDQALLAYQDLQQLAYNDAYLNYHIVPATTVMPFFQAAAPLNWTKLTSQDDKALRIVSGGSGGSAGGGSQLISAVVTLAHTHSISQYSHSHNVSHSHAWGSSTQGNGGNLTAVHRAYDDGSGHLAFADPAGTGGPTLKIKTTTLSATTTLAIFGHNHNSPTGSALSNFTFAYVDLILCSKN